MKKIFVLLLCLLCLGGELRSQQPQKPDEQKKEQEGFQIGVEVNLVTVPVTVRKRDSGFFKGLPQSAFQIFEDGEEQEILHFAQEGVPTRIVVLLDISGSVRSEWGSIKLSTKRFLDNLKPEDQFALVTFNESVRLKMDWGRETARLGAVLTSVYCQGSTSLWDAIWVASTDVLKGIKEKKAIILMSDGLDSGSTVSYNEMLDAAMRSEAMVYVVSKTEAVRQSIMYALAQERVYQAIPHEAFVDADLALRKIAYETGGRVLYPNSFGQLDNVYAEVAEELRSQYTMTYVSSNKMKDGGYRRIKVMVNEPAAMVSARPGYFAPNARLKK